MKSNTKSRNDWNPEPYIDFVANSRSELTTQNRRRMVYKTVRKSMFGCYWEMHRNSVSDIDVYMWLRLWFENVDEFDRISNANLAVNESDFRGPKAYAKSLRDEIKSIKNHIESAARKETENNRNRELKKAHDEAVLFMNVSKDFYRVERHGEFLSQSEYNSMVQFCKEIVAKYAAVSTLYSAA